MLAIDKTNWNGVGVLKGPLEIVIMNDFLYRERPQTVIELGSFTGGCALWMADTLKCFGVKSHIYSIDYNFDNLHKRTEHRDDITFIQGDLREIEKILPEKMLKVCDYDCPSSTRAVSQPSTQSWCRPIHQTS